MGKLQVNGAASLTGLLSAHGGISLNESTAQETPAYLLGIKAFADGGNVIWQSIGDISVGHATSSSACTGNAATATKLKTARTLTIGASGKTFNGSANVSWTPFEMRLTRAQYNVGTNMNQIADHGCELGMANLSGTNTNINPGGGTSWHHYINMTWSDCVDNNGDDSNEWCTQIATKAGTTDLWVRSRSGGNITDGTAWAANWTRILTGSNYTAVLDGRYVNTSGDTMTGLLTTNIGDHKSIKIGAAYLTAASGSNGEIVLQNGHLRFGGDSWDYDVWAGLKYNPSNKYIYLGLADGSIFTANNSQSGGRILTPGISYFHVGNQTTYYFTDGGTLNANTAYTSNWFRSTGKTGWYSESYGGGWYMTDTTYIRTFNSKRVWIGNNLHIGTSDGAGTGLALYSTSLPNSYGIHMSYTSSYGTYGSVSGDWATYFCFDGATNRGWIFKHAGTNVCSISGTGAIYTNDYIYTSSYLQANTHLYLTSTTSKMYMRYNNAWHAVIENHANGNVTFDACGGFVYPAYSNRSLGIILSANTYGPSLPTSNLQTGRIFYKT